MFENNTVNQQFWERRVRQISQYDVGNYATKLTICRFIKENPKKKIYMWAAQVVVDDISIVFLIHAAYSVAAISSWMVQIFGLRTISWRQLETAQGCTEVFLFLMNEGMNVYSWQHLLGLPADQNWCSCLSDRAYHTQGPFSDTSWTHTFSLCIVMCKARAPPTTCCFPAGAIFELRRCLSLWRNPLVVLSKFIT